MTRNRLIVYADYYFGQSLHSLIRNLHLYHVKVMARHIQRNIDIYVRAYVKQGISILALAKRKNISPCMISRYIVEKVTGFEKKDVTRSMRDPMVVLGDPSIIMQEYVESELPRAGSKDSNG